MPARRLPAAVAGLALVAALLVPALPAAAFSTGGPGGAVPPPPASKADPTMTAAVKTSTTARKAVSITTWTAAPHAKVVVQRESGGNCRAVSPSGLYRGKWQLSASFWKAYGGTTYAKKADLASCAEQDKVAYKGWVAAWWHPWGG